MSSSNNYPPGAIIPEETITPGEKKCNKCTHGESEHIDGKHCKALMFEFPLDVDQKKFKAAGYDVVNARQLCNCKEFEEA